MICRQFVASQNIQALLLRHTSVASSLFIVQKIQTAPIDRFIGWDADT